MRWTPKSKTMLRGQLRTRIKFAWFPVKVQTTWVWLERYIVEEEVFDHWRGWLYWGELSVKNKDGVKEYPSREFYE